jgi:hypothetical protein
MFRIMITLVAMATFTGMFALAEFHGSPRKYISTDAYRVVKGNVGNAGGPVTLARVRDGKELLFPPPGTASQFTPTVHAGTAAVCGATIRIGLITRRLIEHRVGECTFPARSKPGHMAGLLLDPMRFHLIGFRNPLF